MTHSLANSIAQLELAGARAHLQTMKTARIRRKR
jgi:hypothetical protein